MRYKDYLKTKHWKNISSQTKQDAGNRCQLCNSGGELHAHHRTYERLGNEMAEDLVCLCADCHAKHHDKNEPENVDFVETASDLLILAVEKTLKDWNFNNEEPFSYWASYVRQNSMIFGDDNRYEDMAKESCPANTALAIQEIYWSDMHAVDKEKELRDLAMMAGRTRC